MNWFFIFLFGGLGSLARYKLGSSIRQNLPNLAFPIGTLFINILGSFIMGLFLSFQPSDLTKEKLKLYLTTGFLGGFTTFSLFEQELFLLIIEKKFLLACVYASASLIVGLLALYAGYALGRFIKDNNALKFY